MSFFSAGISALSSAQLGLTTTGHNINSVNTPGFHRQEIVQATNPALLSGSGFIGQGVHVATIKRTYSEFLDRALLQAQTQSSQLDTYFSEIKQVDSMLADTTTGVSPALQDFFKLVGDVSTSPESVPARQALIGGANALVSRFNTIADRFSQLSDSVNNQIAESVGIINSYAQQIAELNNQITFQTGGSNQTPNDLLDQRENLISELNKQIRTTTITQSDGTMSLFIGTGQPLVVGPQVFTLTAARTPEDQQRFGVAFKTGTVFLADSTLTGGKLGGLLDYRNDALDPAQNMLGRVAIGLAQSFNDQHRLGQDLSGNVGKDFFHVPTFGAVGRTTNTGNGVVTATLADVQSLTSSDYRLVYTGTAGSEYNLIRLSDSTVTTATSAQLAAGHTVDGLTFTLTGGAPNANDSFLIQPTRYAARDITLSSTINAAAIAAATPIRTNAALANVGSGKISAGAVNSFNDKVTLTYDLATNTFDVLDVSTGITLASDVAYASGASISYNGWTVTISGAPADGDVFTVERMQTSTSSAASISVATLPSVPSAPWDSSLTNSIQVVFDTTTTYHLVDTNGNPINGQPTAGLTFTPNTNNLLSVNGWNVTLSGAPEAGDTFTIGANGNGVSDSRNAMLLAQIQTKGILGGGATNIQDAYGEMVNQVGNKTAEVQVTSAAQTTLVEQAKNAQQSTSGVNLDEEAANLLRYQQAYQAAGKMMSIAATLFDVLLSIGQ